MLLQAAQLQGTGRLDEARTLCEQILVQSPDHPAALHLMGAIATQMGDAPRAIELLRKAAALQPQNPGVHSSLGIALAAYGQLDESIECQNRALSLNPNYARAHCNLGTALGAKGQANKAIPALQRAIQLQPNYPEALSNLGNVLSETGLTPQAIESLAKAIALRPNYPEAHYNLGNAHATVKRFGEAVKSFQKAIEVRPSYAKAHGNLANALSYLGRLDESIETYRRAVSLDPNDAQIHSNLIFTLYYHPSSTDVTIKQELDRWNAKHAAPLENSIRPHANDRTPDRPLRIGYVSPDFCRHSVARFLVPLTETHDRSGFEIVAYSSVIRPDDMTVRLRNSTKLWRDMNGVSDEQFADQVREDRIDILVDLALHTARNRLPVFARKPAPVQMTYLAYCGSSGMKAMDYRLTDPYLDPHGGDKSGYSERSARLERSYWCYWPTNDEPPIGQSPGEQNGHITFGCLNNFGKVTIPTLQAWAKLLQETPTSRLILHVPSPEHTPHIRQNFHAVGIDTSRITLTPTLASKDYFALYNQIDIALDPFPFGGGTTTCDALWMGVPVVSLAGPTAVSRAGLSLLSNVGLPDLVAKDVDQYINIATRLANDVPRLKELRSSMRTRMQTSPLMDANAFTKNIEGLYRAAWKTWCTRGPG